LSNGEEWDQLRKLRQAREEFCEKDSSLTSALEKGVVAGLTAV